MGKSTSSDLRIRIVDEVRSGQTRRGAANRFAVSAATAVRVLKRFNATGSVEPARQGRPKGSGKLGAHRQAIIEKVTAQPDITMPELAAWLEAEKNVIVDPSNLSKLLRQAGLTYKKNAAGLGTRTA